MEPLTLQRKDAGDLLGIPEDDTLWFALGESEKQAYRETAEAMVRDGITAADETFGLKPRIGFEGGVDRAVRQSVDAYLDDWWLAMEKTERAALRRSLQQFAAGELAGGFPELRGKVEGIFGTARGRMIAETETTRLWAIGNEISMDQAGVEVLEWRTANDDRVDPDCQALDERLFPVNGGGPRPPLHPRCRCAIIPTDVKGNAFVQTQPVAQPTRASGTGKGPSPLDVPIRKRTKWDEAKQSIGDRKVFDDEFAAITEYKQDSERMNAALRSDAPLTESVKERLTPLEGLIEDAVLFEDTTLYRGVQLERNTAARLQQPGSTFSDDAFQSFTSDASIADEFAFNPASDFPVSDPVIVRMRTEAKRGDNVLELLDLNPNDLEAEHIFQRGTGWRVTDSSIINPGTESEILELFVERIPGAI